MMMVVININLNIKECIPKLLTTVEGKEMYIEHIYFMLTLVYIQWPIADFHQASRDKLRISEGKKSLPFFSLYFLTGR